MKNIAVVDDHRPDITLFQNCIPKGRARLFVYTEPMKFLHDVRNRVHEYDVAFIDYKLPELKGPDLVVLARAHQPNMKFIVVSNLTEREQKELCDKDRVHVDGYLHKAIDLEPFCRSVKKMAGL